MATLMSVYYDEPIVFGGRIFILTFHTYNITPDTFAEVFFINVWHLTSFLVICSEPTSCMNMRAYVRDTEKESEKFQSELVFV